jgi:hypothetical protein
VRATDRRNGVKQELQRKAQKSIQEYENKVGLAAANCTQHYPDAMSVMAHTNASCHVGTSHNAVGSCYLVWLVLCLCVLFAPPCVTMSLSTLLPLFPLFSYCSSCFAACLILMQSLGSLPWCLAGVGPFCHELCDHSGEGSSPRGGQPEHPPRCQGGPSSSRHQGGPLATLVAAAARPSWVPTSSLTVPFPIATQPLQWVYVTAVQARPGQC